MNHCKNYSAAIGVLTNGFGSKKQAGFVQMSRLLEFDAPHRTREAAKYRQKPTFFERNGSRLSSYTKTAQ
ncbi:MAG TPA: hypothetical protein PK971_09245 [Saprospiraceae bacterium]|nr:hypothetical protein [Saprospiraceae bacterium]